MVRLESAAQFHVAMRSRVETPMDSQTSWLPPGPYFEVPPAAAEGVTMGRAPRFASQSRKILLPGVLPHG